MSDSLQDIKAELAKLSKRIEELENRKYVMEIVSFKDCSYGHSKIDKETGYGCMDAHELTYKDQDGKVFTLAACYKDNN